MGKWGRFFAGVISAVLLVTAASTLAEGRTSRGFKSCNSYKTSDEFVRDATSYCLKTGNSSTCERQAQRYFDYCGFAGDYKEISHRVYKKLFVVYMLAQARDVSQINSR